MNYPTYEDRIAQAAEVLRTLTTDQVDAVKVLTGLVDTIGEYREKLSGYPETQAPNVKLTQEMKEYQYRMGLYVQFANALYEAGKK